MDRVAREGFTFLMPEFHNRDLMVENMDEIGHKILDLGKKLYEGGSMPCNRLWDKEESPEFAESLELWAKALEATGVADFDRLLQKAAALANEGYAQMGNLAPRMASLRWNCCMCWIAARSAAVLAVSIGNSFGSVSVQRHKEVCHAAKHQIFELLRLLTKEYPVLTIFDFDLVGHGVWHDGKREDLPKLATDDWCRRSMEFDVVKLCYQALQLPPESMNPSAATFIMVQPYLTPEWLLPPPEAPRRILERHHWFMEFFQPEIDDLHTKAWIDGRVLHMERAPEFQHDFSDPLVRERVERGDELGKGDQEDGKPGAIHGSVALMYAALMTTEKVEHIHVYSGLLEIDEFFETLLRYGPPLLTLELSGSLEAFTKDVLRIIKFAGPSLKILDISECNVNEDMVETLVEVLEACGNVKHVDLAHNLLDGQAAALLMASLCENRIDIPSIRFDGNPLGDIEEFRSEVAAVLAARGEQVVAGGELVLHLEDDMIRWYPKPKEGHLAYRIRDEGSLTPKPVAIKEVRTMANTIKKKLDKYEKQDPAAQTSGGQDWLWRQRQVNQKIFDSPLLDLYKMEIQHRVKMQEEAEAAKQAAEEPAK